MPILILVLLALTSSNANASDYEKKKAETLKTPVFQSTREKEAVAKKALATPVPTLKDLPNNTAAAPLTAPPVTTYTPTTNTLVINPSINLEKPKELKAKRNDGICGEDPYLKKYCYYPDSLHGWIICSERWSLCLNRVELRH